MYDTGIYLLMYRCYTGQSVGLGIRVDAQRGPVLRGIRGCVKGV